MPITTLTSKGQIVIPSRMRARFKMKKGTRIMIEEQGEAMVLRPLTPGYLEKLSGILKTKGKLSRAIIEEHKKARTEE
jgi:AbrB family looped-hinge helix DNA binding protein